MRKREGEGCNEDFVMPSFSNGMEPLIGRAKLLDKVIIMAVAQYKHYHVYSQKATDS